MIVFTYSWLQEQSQHLDKNHSWSPNYIPLIPTFKQTSNTHDNFFINSRFYLPHTHTHVARLGHPGEDFTDQSMYGIPPTPSPPPPHTHTYTQKSNTHCFHTRLSATKLQVIQIGIQENEYNYSVVSAGKYLQHKGLSEGYMWQCWVIDYSPHVYHTVPQHNRHLKKKDLIVLYFVIIYL